MLTRSAVHRDVIADVSDTWSIRGALLNQPRPRRRFTSKGFSWHHRGRGGGAFCTIREKLNRFVERPKAKNATRKFGGECDCVGDANHPGCYKYVSSSKQSYWCGQSARFWLCSHVTTCVQQQWCLQSVKRPRIILSGPESMDGEWLLEVTLKCLGGASWS